MANDRKKRKERREKYQLKKASLLEPEKQKQKEANTKAKQAWRSRLCDEKKEQLRRSDRIRKKRERENLTQDQKKEVAAYQKIRRANMDVKKAQKIQNKNSEAHLKRYGTETFEERETRLARKRESEKRKRVAIRESRIERGPISSTNISQAPTTSKVNNFSSSHIKSI